MWACGKVVGKVEGVNVREPDAVARETRTGRARGGRD